MKYFPLLALVFCMPLVQAQDRPLKIGAVLSLSSYAAPFGQPEANSARMAIDECNAQGGINGRRLELIVEDNQTSMTETVKAFQKLVSVDKVPAVLGPNWAEFSTVLAPLAQRNQVVLLSASGWTTDLTKDRDYVFTTMASHDDMVRPLGRKIAVDGLSEVVLAINPGAYLESVADALTRELNKHNVKIRERALFTTGTQDYRGFVGRLKQEGQPALVLILIQNGEDSAMLRQLRALQYSGKIYASNNLLQEEVVQRELSLAEGVIAFDYHYIRDPNDEFINRYRERFGSEPNESAPRAYDNARLLVQAMRDCGINSRQIRDCLTRADFKGISGRIRFNSQRNVIDSFGLSRLVEVKNGRVIELDNPS